MEIKYIKDLEISLATWMVAENLTDATLSDELGVTRQTVWRWREQGIIPHKRDRNSIQDMAGSGVVIVFGDS